MCMYVCGVCMYAYIRMYDTYIHTYIYVFVYTYVYSYIHTHTHTHIRICIHTCIRITYIRVNKYLQGEDAQIRT